MLLGSFVWGLTSTESSSLKRLFLTFCLAGIHACFLTLPMVAAITGQMVKLRKRQTTEMRGRDLEGNCPDTQLE